VESQQEITGPASAEPVRILIVDDDPFVLDFCREVLLDAGYKAIVAHDGAEALRFIESGQSLNLVITDVIMPGMDGMELIPKLRAFVSNRVIAMSGGGMTNRPWNYLDDAKHLGVISTLSKPFSGDDLLAAVRKALAKPAR
jgi:CheY-like chemotaxis protein